MGRNKVDGTPDALGPAGNVHANDGAEILAGDFLGFGLGKDGLRRLTVQSVERLLRIPDDHDMVTIFFQDFAQRAHSNGIRFDAKNAYLIWER